MATSPPGTLFVVSTSHMDWDWVATFEQYYNIGNPQTTHSVRDILQTAISLIGSAPPSGGAFPYQYNLAEVAWLQRYILDNPGLPPQLAGLQGGFVLLGGGITSPDNLVCNGEAFIRNYLVGRAYVKKLGLGVLLSDVCWIPDDFGQDPQLPVVLTSMGMKGVSFWRVPGNEPAPPPPPPTPPPPTGTPGYLPIAPPHIPLSTQLQSAGVTFLWQAADGATILAQQMWDGYGVIWDQATSGDAATQATTLASFVQAHVVQPGNLFMAPCGGDFSMPSINLPDAVSIYNQNPPNGVQAVLGTFEDFIGAMNQYEAANSGSLTKYTDFDSSNYWTGCFAGRVELKIRQQRTVNLLMAAETLATLLRGQANISGSVLDGIDRAIGAAWENLVPSTHHDYVTGTAPDQTYWMEQQPLSALALAQSSATLGEAMARLGEAVKAVPQTGEIPYVVFNPSGFARQVGTLVEIPARPELLGMNSFRLAGESTVSPLQTSQNGNKLLPYPNLGSTGYGCVYLSRSSVHPVPLQPVATTPPTSFTFGNGVVQITVTQASGWAIESLQNQGQELLAAGPVNQIAVYYETTSAYGDGNLYQMGNELDPLSTTRDGFFANETSAFQGLDGAMVETGPYRWHFVGRIQNQANSLTLTVEYILETGEPLVRMRITGQAGATAISVVTSWPFQDANGLPPSGMSYGTGNHWNGPAYTPYWQGPTFRATHDYVTLLPQGNEAGNPLAAIYHEGMRAWGFDGTQLMGILFRNAPGQQRGAAGTDTAIHVQNYAFRVPGVGNATTCQPLQESLAFQVPQPAAQAIVAGAPLNSLAETGMLASMQEPNAIIRVARSQAGSGGTPTIMNTRGGPCPFSFVLRIYQPTNVTTETFHVSVPFVETGGRPSPEVSLVTALEEEMSVAQPPAYTDGIITIPSMATLATLRIQSVGTKTELTNGKST